MSFSDPFQQFVPFANGVDSMGQFWSQFPGSNEQQEVNSQFDHDPPLKRVKSSDSQSMNHHNNIRAPAVNSTVNQPTGRIFFKTRLCAKFRTGQCKNGENCNFAHGEEDLRKPPPNWQELVGGGGRADDRGGSNYSNGGENWEDDDRIIHRMKLCKKFYSGEECPYGEKCNFLHKEPPKFRDVAPPPRFRDNNSRESSAISIGTTGPPMAPPRVPDNYEVNRMMNNGNVNSNGNAYGNSNGHGSVCVDVLRANSRPVYWKTKLCTRFEVTGQCQYGDNCHFAHGQAELLLPGGRPADAEPANTSNIPPKRAPASASDPIPVKTDTVFPSNDEGQTKNCFAKWKVTKKINRIYGDWIDDLPLILPDEMDR